jgi:hypothetical protein
MWSRFKPEFRDCGAYGSAPANPYSDKRAVPDAEIMPKGWTEKAALILMSLIARIWHLK